MNVLEMRVKFSYIDIGKFQCVILNVRLKFPWNACIEMVFDDTNCFQSILKIREYNICLINLTYPVFTYPVCQYII